MSKIASASKKVEQEVTAKANKVTSPEAVNRRNGASLYDAKESEEKLMALWKKEKEEALARIRKDKNDKRGILVKSEAAMRAATEIVGYSPASRQTEAPAGKPKTAKINTSREKKVKVWHKFSKELAASLNPEQPDITLALILYGLSLWMDTAKRMPKKLNYCYRSLGDLEDDYPYMTRGRIENALERAATKLKGDFSFVPGGKTMRFRLSPKLMKRATSEPMMIFKIKDAVNYGEEKAILIANLHWQIEHVGGGMVDDAGNAYYGFSPTKLSKIDAFTGDPAILPFSRWTISRLLKELCEDDHVFVQCPSLSTYYGLASEMVPVAPAGQCQDGAESDIRGAESDDDGAESDDFLCADSNKIVNGDSKDIEPDIETASPTMSGSMASPGLRHILAECNKALVVFRQREKDKAGVRRTYPTVPPSQLPYDIICRPADDLPYDAILRDSSGHRYTRTRQIREAVDLIANGWRIQNFPYTAKDRKDLEMLFWQNPEFTPEDFDEIQGWLPANRFGYLKPEDFKKQPDKWDCFKVCKGMRNATTLLKYLPEVIEEIYTESVEWVDGKIVRNGYIPDNLEAVIDHYRTKDKPMERLAVEHECNPVLDIAA